MLSIGVLIFAQVLHPLLPDHECDINISLFIKQSVLVRQPYAKTKHCCSALKTLQFGGSQLPLKRDVVKSGLFGKYGQSVSLEIYGLRSEIYKGFLQYLNPTFGN